MVALNTFAAAMALVPLVFTHPSENVEIMKREMNTANAVELKKRSAARRAAKVTKLRQKRGLTTRHLSHKKRDLTALDQWTNVKHNLSTTGHTLSTPEDTLFGSNDTCALVPETTIGPYYVTGEQIRSNITEDQVGVPMHIEMQFVDMNTCEPVEGLLADIWHCNSIGVYPGIDTSEGEGGLNTTYLRGIQESDAEGAVSFDTLFPGHYDDRVTHLHIGQLYFEDTLVKAIEATSPYTENTIAYTTLEEDGWMLEEATTNYDPFIEYVQLSESLEDGLLAWITVAVDLSSDHSTNLTAHAHLYETGGVTVEGSSKGLPPSNPNSS